MKDKKGFTLAEVLITLAIIGVVAAITIPSIKLNADRNATVEKIKKHYNSFSSALNLAIAEHGALEAWDYTTERNGEDADRIFKTYFAPHLQIIKYCGTQKGCWADTVYKYGNGDNYDNLDTINERTKGILSDGTLFSFRTGTCFADPPNSSKNDCGAFYIDVNGFKAPNRFGHDVFEFWIFDDGILEFPYSGKKAYYTDENLESNCLGRGWGCSAKIARDGWKITYW